MKEAQQEHLRTHLTCILEGLERQVVRPPHTYIELEAQRIAADSAMVVSLEVVCELLPTEIQPIVRRLVQLRETLWTRKLTP